MIHRLGVDVSPDDEEAAFARLVESHHAGMLRLAYVVTGDRSLAEDAVQSAWTSAWRNRRSVRDETRVRPWLLSIAANEARQSVRRRRRFRIVELDLTTRGAARADPGVGIDRLDLINALARLTPEDRALLALRYVSGFDAVEIGEMSGRSASGIRARLSRLTARLRKELVDD